MLSFKTGAGACTLALLLSVIWSPVQAGGPGYLGNPQLLAQRKNNFAESRLLSKSQAAAVATSRHGGKVLKVENTDTKGNYRVRLLLESGRIKTVAINSPKRKKKT